MGKAFGLGRRAALAAVLTLLVTAAALAVALAAASGARGDGRELSTRLVPAAQSASGLLERYTAQQVALRNYVTSAKLADLAPFQQAAGQIPAQQARLARLVAGYHHMPATLAAAESAQRAWLARVAAPELAAMRRGDLARARALQANIPHTRPFSLAVRNRMTLLQNMITHGQAMVTSRLIGAQQVLVGALIAMGVVVAVIAAGGFYGVRRWLLVPFAVVRRAADRVAAGDYTATMPAAGPAELAALSRSTELMRLRLVTALGAAEAAEEKFRRLFDAAPDATLTVAEDRTILMANAQAELMFGYDPGALAGRRADALLPDAADAPEDHLARLVNTPRPGALQTTAVARDGRQFPVESTVTALPAGTGLIGLVSLRDISERLAAQAEGERLRSVAERERYQRRLEQSQRMESLGQLVGGVAHDFNNLLGVITGYTAFITEQAAGLADGQQRDAMLGDMQQVSGAAQRATALTRQLLTFARRDIVHPQVLDVNEVISNTEHLLRRTLGEQVELAVNLAATLPPVLADPGQLDQILINLAVNARDAMPGGGKLTIDTASLAVDAAYATDRPGLSPGRYVRIRVSDTGTGMDPQTVAHAFEPFYTTKPAGQGTGLGLATVHGIITRAGGYAQIYSEPGLGTTITALLPVTDQAAAETGPEPPAPAPGQGETILVAEDQDSLARLIHRILDRHGYHAITVTTPEDALRRASDLSQPIDLLLTDAIMPGLLGNDLAARIRALRPGLPVVYMSGYAQPILDTQGALDPHSDLLEKPFSESTLLNRVQRAMHGHS
jgi:PAS domain S-box-containing protein